MQTFLRVTNISNQTAPNGRQYQTLTFNQFGLIGTKEVKSRQTRTRNIWGAGKTGDGKVINADSYFQTLAVGDVVEGVIASFDTTAYTVNDRTVNVWTGVIFSDENDGVNYVNGQLKSNGACVVDQHGVATKPAQIGQTNTPELTVAEQAAESAADNF